MVMLADIALTTGDWIKIGGILLGQAVVIGIALTTHTVSVISRISKLESKVDETIRGQIADLQSRTTRLETQAMVPH